MKKARLRDVWGEKEREIAAAQTAATVARHAAEQEPAERRTLGRLSRLSHASNPYGYASAFLRGGSYPAEISRGFSGAWAANGRLGRMNRGDELGTISARAGAAALRENYHDFRRADGGYSSPGERLQTRPQFSCHAVQRSALEGNGRRDSNQLGEMGAKTLEMFTRQAVPQFTLAVKDFGGFVKEFRQAVVELRHSNTEPKDSIDKIPEELRASITLNGALTMMDGGILDRMEGLLQIHEERNTRNANDMLDRRVPNANPREDFGPHRRPYGR